MVRSSMQKHIHAEVVEKVREALNIVHQVKRADWDLCILAILWAYRTMCKILTVQAPRRLEYEATEVSPIILG